MNLVDVLLKTHSASQANKIARYVGKDPARFAALVAVFLEGPYRVTQRASWPLSKCVEKHPELIKPHLRLLLKKLKEPDLHPAVRRNAMRLLQFIHVPKNLQGMVADIGFSYLSDTREPVAVRVFAMTVLANMAKEIPELKNELIVMIEDQLPYSSAAFISRGRKTLKMLRCLVTASKKP